MALAILLCNQFISSGLPTFTGDYEDWAKTLIYLGEMTFTVALTVGTVKGARNRLPGHWDCRRKGLCRKKGYR